MPADTLNEPALVPEAQRTRQLQRWFLGMALGTVAIVALIVGAGVYFVQTLPRQQTPLAERAGPAAQPDAIPAPPATDTGRRPQVSPIPPAPAETRPPANDTKPPITPAPAASAERALSLVGTLTGAHLYQGYLNIGMLADAAENELYTDAEARRLLSTIESLLDTVDQNLAKLPADTLEVDDRKKLERSRQLGLLLRTQAKELRAYWETPEKDKELKKEHEVKFHAAREQAWTRLKDLLEIED